MKMRMKVAVGAVIALAATSAIGTAALATPPSGPPQFESLPAPFKTPAGATTGDPVTTGTLDGPTKAKNDGTQLKTNGDVDVTTFELNYPPGSFSGWHKHPGIVIAVVRSGAVWRQVGCTATKFSPGESFTEIAPHYVSNVVTDTNAKDANAVLEITQLYPAGTKPADLRVDQPAPRCPYGIHYVE